jgi:hypothetical protein
VLRELGFGGQVHRIVLCIAVLFGGCSCSETSVPGLAGKVVDVVSGKPVANALVVATFSGHTRARDTWFLAHSGLDHDHCYRVITRADNVGNFVIHRTTLNSYFGSPKWSAFAYQSSFRSTFPGRAMKDPEAGLLTMWPESSAAEFSSFTGERVNYGKIREPARFRDLQLSRARYLDQLLDHGVASSCEMEAASDQRSEFVMDLYREWLSLGGPFVNKGRSLACTAFAAFRLDHPTEKETAEFLALKEEIHQGCAAAKKKDL